MSRSEAEPFTSGISVPYSHLSLPDASPFDFQSQRLEGLVSQVRSQELGPGAEHEPLHSSGRRSIGAGFHTGSVVLERPHLCLIYLLDVGLLSFF